MKILRIKLKNFRQFESREVEFDPNITIIHGDNTVGKSSILEALFFLTNHQSPFTNNVKELLNSKQNETPFFRIEADIEDNDGDIKNYAIFQSGSSRQYFIDQHKTTKKKYGEDIASTIFSPEQIELLMISPGHRRDFLDILINKVDRDFSDINSKMLKVLKQRNAYLKKLSKKFYESGHIEPQDKQFQYWSELFSHLSSGVMTKRAEYLDKMQTKDFMIEYRPSLDVSQFTQLISQEELEKVHLKKLQESMKRDIAMGHTTIGAHRDDWDVIAGKNVRIHGSRGEKRLAVGRIIVRSQEIFYEVYHSYPILLLDDISSELDKQNTDQILDDGYIERQQTIITTINLEDIPKRVVEKATLISI